MPRCYLLAVANGSAIDMETNQVTLFALAERVGIAHDAPAQSATLEVHCYLEFEPEERGRPYEVQTLVSRASKSDEVRSDPQPLQSTTAWLRMRLRGLAIPGPGLCRVHVQWREAGTSDWTPSELKWPLTVEVEPEAHGPDADASG